MGAIRYNFRAPALQHLKNNNSSGLDGPPVNLLKADVQLAATPADNPPTYVRHRDHSIGQIGIQKIGDLSIFTIHAHLRQKESRFGSSLSCVDQINNLRIIVKKCILVAFVYDVRGLLRLPLIA